MGESGLVSASHHSGAGNPGYHSWAEIYQSRISIWVFLSTRSIENTCGGTEIKKLHQAGIKKIKIKIKKSKSKNQNQKTPPSRNAIYLEQDGRHSFRTYFQLRMKRTKREGFWFSSLHKTSNNTVYTVSPVTPTYYKISSQTLLFLQL